MGFCPRLSPQRQKGMKVKCYRVSCQSHPASHLGFWNHYLLGHVAKCLSASISSIYNVKIKCLLHKDQICNMPHSRHPKKWQHNAYKHEVPKSALFLDIRPGPGHQAIPNFRGRQPESQGLCLTLKGLSVSSKRKLKCNPGMC